MKVIIYFGHHKVGSTALQSYLYRNQLALMRQGLLYPGVESESLLHLTAELLGARDDLSEPQAARLTAAALSQAPSMNVREPHNAMAFQMLAQASKGRVPKWHVALPGVPQMIRALRMQEKYLLPETVVICSEVMSNFGLHHPELIDRVREIYPNADHQLYCVLRRPDEYLISWHAQRLRFGDKVAALSDGAARKYANTIHFEYRKTVEPWLQRFPEAPFHLHNYADVLKSGGSVEDFFATNALDMPAGTEPPGRANESLPRAAMEIARRGNHDLAPGEAAALRRYLLNSGDDVKPIPNKEIEMYGAALRAELLERFTPIHDWLSKITGQAAFFPDLDEMARCRPVSEAEASADFLAQIPLKALPGETLRDYIRALRQEAVA
ncbi:hypothetical protein [Pseudodonghicola xiamenensis]|uniref:Sulfotransferase family protein n=1 Tax=Pseudodonghicola xiamenensis TaxID=337702 RepID=A0A8J3H8A4_9RHOB|nr:hypothetical protein [Pseudodonghicola xiamenensis]GHG97905.1 hypothetical protein GCM10010961_32950 [Pseudodonghicola xiamenensis]